MFIDKLIDRIKELDNPTVAGLDPKLEYIPEHIRKEAAENSENLQAAAARAILRFNMELIDALCDVVPAVKPQLAYYEMYGLEGLKAFEATARYAAGKGMLVIADGKRNDIGSTAEAYSSAFLGRNDFGGGAEPVFDTDALTVNPYLGVDGIKPFIDDCAKYDKGIFILVKTSNKSSGQLQDLVTQDGRHIYEVVAGLVDEWGSTVTGKYGYSSVGAVVGATYPEQAEVLRKIMKNAYILVPGYGAQGGTAKSAAVCFNKDGLGAIVNASRSIMCAWKSERWAGSYSSKEFAAAARAEAIRMRDELNAAIKSEGGNL